MPKQQTTVSFDEIFYYAEKRHGIQWNPCNDLFFRTEVIRYHRATSFYPFDGIPDDPLYNVTEPDYDLTDEIKQNVINFTTSNEEVCSLIKSDPDNKLSGIATLIINQFAIENELSDLSEFIII